MYRIFGRARADNLISVLGLRISRVPICVSYVPHISFEISLNFHAGKILHVSRKRIRKCGLPTGDCMRAVGREAMSAVGWGRMLKILATMDFDVS